MYKQIQLGLIRSLNEGYLFPYYTRKGRACQLVLGQFDKWLWRATRSVCPKPARGVRGWPGGHLPPFTFHL
jgi:hypothetical protein